jgi:signal transduction histidine kinase
MSETLVKQERLTPEHLFKISKITTQGSEWKPALEKIFQLVNPFFIFDNLAVYLIDSKTDIFDVGYARAKGRGRSAEADASWGENLAAQIIANERTILKEPDPDPKKTRLDLPYLLGIPLIFQTTCFGAIIFVRFGGPLFSDENVKLAEFIAGQISLMIHGKTLQNECNILEAQQKQAEVQENFISTITHELRSPLGFIKGYTTTLLRSDTTWDQTVQQEFLEIIDHETDRLEELIGNLLDSARLQSGQMQMQLQPVLPDSLINAVITRTQLHYPNLAIEAKIPKNLGPINGDPVRLAQVLENLISNAIKYAPNSPITIFVENNNDQVCITIQDQGQGIPEHYLAHLFERFFRVPNQAPNMHGSGLGLYICKQIIQAHHGTISAESTIGQGSSFIIKLPRIF